MHTLLVPMDGSAIAKQALPYVRMLATILSARIHFVRVLATVDREHMLSSASTVLYDMGSALENQREREQDIWRMLREQARDYLEAHAAPLRVDGFDVVCEVRMGLPAEEIVTCAEHRHATLIVIATHGYSGLRRWALGSVTDKVVHATRKPIFVVRGAASESLAAPHLKRLMVPLDGSPLARKALPFAFELATCAHAELLLLSACKPVTPDSFSAMPLGIDIASLHIEEMNAQLQQQAAQELNAAAGEYRSHAFPVTTHVVTGYPAEVIVDEAARHHIDVIVMATHGYGGLQRWALGSVADKVLHATSTPLVLIRAL